MLFRSIFATSCLIGAGLAVHWFALRCLMENHIEKRLGRLEVSQHAAASTLSYEDKAELRRYVDDSFSEAQRLTKSFQAEARAGVLQSRQHVDSVLFKLEHDLRAELARIRKKSDDSEDRNNLVLTHWRAADEKKLAELIKKIEQIHGEVQSWDRKLSSALLQQTSRVAANEGKYAELNSEFAKLRQEFQQKLNIALSQVSSQAASEKKLAELTKVIERIQGEVRSYVGKLESALFQQNSQSANEGDYAELSSEVAKLHQKFQKADRKLNTVLSMKSQAASEGMSAECRNEIARLSEEIRRLNEEIRNTDRKVNSAVSKMNSRASSEGNFAECSNEISRLRQKVSRIEGTVDRLVEDSRKPPTDPGVGSSAPKAKKYKQD